MTDPSAHLAQLLSAVEAGDADLALLSRPWLDGAPHAIEPIDQRAHDAAYVLAVLAASELAHRALIAAEEPTALRPEGRDVRGDPRFVPIQMAAIHGQEETWRGASIEALAEVIRRMKREDELDQARHSTPLDGALSALKPVLAEQHDEKRGVARYRIGLKGLADEIAAHRRFASLVRRAHQHVVDATVIAYLSSETERLSRRDESYAPPALVDAFVTTVFFHAASIEGVDQDVWRVYWFERLVDMAQRALQSGAAMEALQISSAALALGGRAKWNLREAIKLTDAFRVRSLATVQIRGKTAALSDRNTNVRMLETVRDGFLSVGQFWPTEHRAALARSYRDRADLVVDAQGPDAALADIDTAIGILEALLDEPMRRGAHAKRNAQNILAELYQYKGLYKSLAGETAASLSAYDRAVMICEELRDMLHDAGETWYAPYRHTLGQAYLGQASHKQYALGIAAVADGYDAAVRVLEALQEYCVERKESFSPDYRDDLARAYAYRANLKNEAGTVEAAIEDYDRAIRVRESLREDLITQGRNWSPTYRDNLASAYDRRATAKRAARGGVAAFGDYGAAIRIHEALRDDLLKSGQVWLPAYRDRLAWAHSGLAEAKRKTKGAAAALEEAETASRIREALRDDLLNSGEIWLSEYRDNLASSYLGRALLKLETDGPEAAFEGGDAAVRICEALRDDLLGAGRHWSATYRGKLARAYAVRAMFHVASKRPALACTDAQAAADISGLLLAECAGHDRSEWHEVEEIAKSIVNGLSDAAGASGSARPRSLFKRLFRK